MKRISTILVTLLAVTNLLAQGWPENYGGVMLQGFYWDSYSDTRWVKLEKQASDLAQTFSLVWIPQSGNCGSQSMGYDDLYWFENYTSSFGDEAQLRSMIKTFKDAGIGTIADVVINHRRNVSSWVDFPRETYKGTVYEMRSTDICANDDKGATKTWATQNGYSLSSNNDTGEGWDGMRDLDHKSTNVQTIVKAYLDFLLNDLGYTGFRYDMVKGYSAEFTKLYNESAKPQFSVGECWDGTNTIRKWIDGTGKQSAAFDFQFRYTVRNAANNGSWNRLEQQNDGNWPLVSSSYEGGAYRRYAVTFVENHDTEYRSSTAQQDPLRKDTLAANAYLLAMPGTPCIFLKHWQAYRPQIKAMVEARRLAGITNTSAYSKFRSATAYYANIVKVGTANRLLVVVGDTKQLESTISSEQWTKILSGHHYAYYLNNQLETAWADQGSGDFTDPFDVRLTAVSATAGAQLVYTTDGSTPTATNGTKVNSGSTLRITATTTLKVGLLTGSTVSGVITRSFTKQEPEQQGQTSIPSFCTVADGEVCAFFEAPISWTNTIYCWAWTDSPADNFTYANKKWPGVACTLVGTADNGNKVWKWTWDGTKQNNTAAAKPAKIIFSNNGSPQTADLGFQNGGYYDESGKVVGVVSGIKDVSAATAQGAVRVYTLGGQLAATLPAGTSVSQALMLLRPGVYVVGGRTYTKN